MKHEWVGPDKVIRWVHCKACLDIGRVSTKDKPGNIDDVCRGSSEMRPPEAMSPVGKEAPHK